MDLNQDYKKLDSLGVESALTLFPEQIINSFDQSYLKQFKIEDFDTIVVSGMGGSSNAGKIVSSYLNSIKFTKPFIVHNDYDLPSFVNSKTLVILNSYSGNTEETLSSFVKARENRCQIIGITTGGKIKDLIENGEIEGVVVDPKNTNPTDFPKSGLGVSLGSLLGVLVSLKIIDLSKEKLDSSLNELKSIRQLWNAKEIAEKIHGFLPILLSASPLIGSLNAGRNAMCEISRNFTQFYDFPEINHVLIEALSKPQSVSNNKYLFFESHFSNERVKLRYKITKNILDEQNLSYLTYELKGTSIFVQLLELPHFCAWVGFYISILDNTDPGPEPWILKLKSALA
jgi:glucose/mannose-6-phosphate isomerase